MEIKKKPSGCTYQWECKYCGKTTRAANKPSGTSFSKCEKSPDKTHEFFLSGN